MGEALVFRRLEVCWARDLSALPRTTRILGSGGAGGGRQGCCWSRHIVWRKFPHGWKATGCTFSWRLFVSLDEEQEHSYSAFKTQLRCYLLQNPPQMPGGRARSPAGSLGSPTLDVVWHPIGLLLPSFWPCRELGERGAQRSRMAVEGRGAEVGAHPGSPDGQGQRRWQLGPAAPRGMGIQSAGYPHAPKQRTWPAEWPPWDPYLGWWTGPVGRVGQWKGKAVPCVSLS